MTICSHNIKKRANIVDSFVMQPDSNLATHNICIAFIQRRPNVFDVVSTLYKYYTNVLWLLGHDSFLGSNQIISRCYRNKLFWFDNILFYSKN